MTPETLVHLIQILEKTVSPDTRELEVAQKFLEQAAVTNLPEFLKSLSDVLQHAGNSPVARMAAGLQIKNLLTCKDLKLKSQYQQRWLSFSENIRNHIKRNCLSALGTEIHRPSSAAQCVAGIAVIELCVGQWQELISILTANVTNPSSTEIMKESTLEAIGYICQDIDSDILTSRANEILTAIVHGMKSDERSDNVRLAATSALFNSLEFTRANFENASERNVIMQVVCEATQSSHTPIQVAALQCLVKIMSTYYQFMEFYMSSALFSITIQAMQSDIDEVSLQGIEFWSTVCDEEMELNIEASDARDLGRPPSRTSNHYILGAYQVLTPVLMVILTHQEEFDDDDEWNPAKAAGVCLGLLANCCRDPIVAQVIPFVKSNISNPDWRYREAAVLAFGSILEGPDTCMLQPLVEQAMPMLTELMYDSSVMVKDTTAWAIGKVCDFVPDAVKSSICPLLEALVNGLAAEPRVAANVCWALSSLAEAAYESAQPDDGSECPTTYMLSNYFEAIVQKLFETAERPDGAQKNLRGAAYEAIMELIKNSAADCYETVRKATMVVLDRLMKVLQMESHIQSSSDREQYNDLQSLLCATLQSVLKKVTAEDAPQISDAIMTALLQMFSSSSKSGGVQQDGLMAVTSLVEVINEGFIKYMDAFKPFLIYALKNDAEPHVCISAVGLVGDICRGIKGMIFPYCDEIMRILLDNLANPDFNRTVKPNIFSALGDIALVIGPKFRNYLQIVMTTLFEASKVQFNNTNDDDLLEYLNELRMSCIDAFTGIIQGFKGEGSTPSDDVKLMNEYLDFIVDYIIVIASDSKSSEGLIAACAGLIGDLVSTYYKDVAKLTENKAVEDMLTAGRRSKDSKVKQVCNWATREIRKFKNQSS